MLAYRALACGLIAQLILSLSVVPSVSAPISERAGALTLVRAIQRAVANNPRLSAASRDIGIAAGRRLQSGAIPNPELSFELDNVAGSGEYRGLRSAETTLQLSQLIELGGKRDARIAAGSAEVDTAYWQLAATRLEIISDTAVAYYSVLASQRRIAIYDTQIAALHRLTPLLQRRVEAGASSPAEVARAQVAVDLVRADREKARTALAVARLELAALMGRNTPDFTHVAGNLAPRGRPPSFQTIQRAIDGNPQLVRFTALRAQRDAELLFPATDPRQSVPVGQRSLGLPSALDPTGETRKPKLIHATPAQTECRTSARHARTSCHSSVRGKLDSFLRPARGPRGRRAQRRSRAAAGRRLRLALDGREHDGIASSFSGRRILTEQTQWTS